MAGSMAITANIGGDSQGMLAMAAVAGQWDVLYARFFNCLSDPSSAHPSLAPNCAARRRRRIRGTWISSSSSPAASLRLLISGGSPSDSILLVAFRGKVLEEHYISKLHFTWPQVSCMSGYPARGSTVVLISYRDSIGQIQKFALRFLTIYDTEKFTNYLKETWEDAGVKGLPIGNHESETSYQSEFVPPTGSPYRPREDFSPRASADTFAHKMQQRLNEEVSHDSPTQGNTNHPDVGRTISTFPPSFTSLLMDCRPVLEKAAAQATVFEEVDLKAQLARCLEDSSFQDILSKVEKAIIEMGDDLML